MQSVYRLQICRHGHLEDAIPFSLTINAVEVLPLCLIEILGRPQKFLQNLSNVSNVESEVLSNVFLYS